MSYHTCQVSTPRAVRLQILDSVLDTPRSQLRERFTDHALQEIEQEALEIEAELRAESRCRDCGCLVPTTRRDRMANELAYVWGA